MSKDQAKSPKSKDQNNRGRVRFGEDVHSSRSEGAFSSPTHSNDGDDDDDFYLYRQPQLNKTQWETEPRKYW